MEYNISGDVDRMRDDPIAKVLDDLLKLDDILACMVARQNMISVMPSDDNDSFKPDQMQDYEALFFVFPDTENALVAIVPALANKGLIEVEMENARREILKIMEEPEKERELVTA
jgi:predicted regulator of Ras-like GTPase activity (Roadblock/LC7/MglB family)